MEDKHVKIRCGGVDDDGHTITPLKTNGGVEVTKLDFSPVEMVNSDLPLNTLYSGLIYFLENNLISFDNFYYLDKRTIYLPPAKLTREVMRDMLSDVQIGPSNYIIFRADSEKKVDISHKFYQYLAKSKDGELSKTVLTNSREVRKILETDGDGYAGILLEHVIHGTSKLTLDSLETIPELWTNNEYRLVYKESELKVDEVSSEIESEKMVTISDVMGGFPKIRDGFTSRAEKRVYDKFYNNTTNEHVLSDVEIGVLQQVISLYLDNLSKAEVGAIVMKTSKLNDSGKMNLLVRLYLVDDGDSMVRSDWIALGKAFYGYRETIFLQGDENGNG